MVGSHLADYLLDNTDWEIHGLIRWRSPLDNIENLIENINNKNRVYLHYGDLRDSQSINKVVSEVVPDYEFSSCGTSYPKTSFDAPLDTYETNINGTSILLEALKSYAIKSVIHVCASSEVLEESLKDKIPINEECSFPSGLAICNLKSWHRSYRKILCRSLQHDYHDNENVYPHWPKKG